ncbi:hypothetical protein FO519_005933 [Halicephalobus sp. NKZ332]|nr:hypothetical protein FO519_005933 [Halicephalobus sp. NKZ332]
MEVECRDQSGVYFPAKATEFKDGKLKLKFEDDALPEGQYPLSDCRYVKPSLQAKSFGAGDLIDALILQSSGKKAYQRAKVREIKQGNYLIIESVEGPTHNDIVSSDECRFADRAKPLVVEVLRTSVVELPDDLKNHSALVCQIFGERLTNTIAQPDGNGAVKVYSTDPQMIKMVGISSSMLINQAKQKLMLTLKQEEVTKKLEQSSICTKSVVEFTVPKDLMGLTIGHEGSNIQRARGIEGIINIIVEESRPNEESCTIKVIADDEDAAIAAKNILHYHTECFKVPREVVSRVIGKKGTTIQDVVDKSGVIRVQIGEDVAGTDGKMPEMTDFFFTGTHESITFAKMLIDMNIQYYKESDLIRENINDIERRLYTGGEESFYSRGFSRNNFAKNTQNGTNSRSQAPVTNGNGTRNGFQKDGNRQNGHQNGRDRGESREDEESEKSGDESENDKSYVGRSNINRPRATRSRVGRSRAVESESSGSEEGESEHGQNWFDWILDFYYQFSDEMHRWLENRPLANFIVVLFIFLIVYSPIILSGPNSMEFYHGAQKTSPKLDVILKGFSNDFEKYFPKEEYLKAVFLSTLNKILVHPDSGAGTITLGFSKEYDYGFFKDSIKKLFSKYLRYEGKNYIIPEEGQQDQVLFYRKIMDLLTSVNGKTVLFIDGIDRLGGRAPLTLQTLSDEYAAEFKNCILILTIMDERFKSLDRFKCNKEVNDFLMEKWKSQVLLADQVFPIVSRVTKLTGCLPNRH